MNRANEARDMTKKLGALAEKYKCAIVLIGHMNKAAGNKAAYRGMGSIDLFAVARSVLLVGRVEGQPDIRAIVQFKNNLAVFGHSKAFQLSEGGFSWLGDYEITAGKVLGGIAPKVNKLEQAKQLLRELAETSNLVSGTEIMELAKEEGVSKRTMESAKKELFGDALKEYNAKQKRKDRCIDDYYEKIRQGKQEKTFYELFIQIGNKDDMAAASENGELAKEILDKFMKGFQERNPRLHVYSAHLHMDEKTPHLHIDFIPFTTGCQRGLSIRVSLKKALEYQGIVGEGRSLTERDMWVQNSRCPLRL